MQLGLAFMDLGQVWQWLRLKIKTIHSKKLEHRKYTPEAHCRSFRLVRRNKAVRGRMSRLPERVILLAEVMTDKLQTSLSKDYRATIRANK
jgi:hypothetical protein